MKQVVPLSDHSRVRRIYQHLRAAFPSGSRHQRAECPHCGIPAPPEGAEFQVEESLQTCHPTSGEGLDRTDGNSLRPGRYRIVQVMGCEGSGRSHFMRLTSLDDSGRRILLCFGYTEESCMDWTGVAAITPTVRQVP